MGKAIATNKKAYRDYFIGDTYECGIALHGAEVKSLRDGKVNFKDSYARIEKNEVFVYNLHINPYKQASYMNEDPDRPRKLLLHKREIKKILSKVMEKNMTLIPTKVYFNNRGLAKMEVALGKGKKMFDKREAIKRKDLARELGRMYKHKRRK